MFGIGPSEMVVLGIVGLLLFGKNLPEVARGLGKSMMEFKKGMSGITEEVNSAIYDNHHHSSASSTASSRPLPQDERDEVTAPKFEPPKFEPVS
jgi:sec-independent protein translocase protein TatA